MRRLAVCALTSMLALTSCAHGVDGTPSRGPIDVDQAYFFAGEVPPYGQPATTAETTTLAYLRALRRIDVCGLVTGDALSKVAEITSVGTLFAFNECDAEIKVSGVSSRQFVTLELGMSAEPPDSCDHVVPLPLAQLPGAPQLGPTTQPSIEVGLIGSTDCDLARQVAAAVAQRVSTAPLPPRDAVAAYPTPLAEHDPCLVLSVLDVTRWNVGSMRPYRCQFSVLGSPAVRLILGPRLVDAATQSSERQQRDGVELYFDPVFCSALSFVGPPMQRKVVGGDYVGPGDVTIRPAVVVETDGNDCAAAVDITVKAAKLYA